MIKGIDHIVITVEDIDLSLVWYREVLGLNCLQNGSRWEAHFGAQKINFHSRPGEFQPAAAKPTAGSIDLCFEVEGDIKALAENLKHRGVNVVEGPVARTGARGAMNSVYLRDPDGNLIELSVYL